MQNRWLPLLLLAALCLMGASDRPRVRGPIGAGTWYPSNPTELQSAVEDFIEKADSSELPGRMVGCILPHSSYKACGALLGAGVKPLRAGQYDRVIVLAPSVTTRFRGCAIPAVHYFATPLGLMPLDGAAIGHLSRCPLITLRSVETRREAYANRSQGRVVLQEQETAIENVLPFLQIQLGEFKLVPIVVGELVDHNGKFDEQAYKRLVITLRDIIDDRTLVVACSNFTRYGKVHEYTPFQDRIAEHIGELDMEAFNLIMAKDMNGFGTYLEKTGNLISGTNCILLQAALLPRAAEGILLDYENTAEATGKPDPSVSYATLAFFDPMAPVPEQVPPEPEEAAPQNTDIEAPADSAPEKPAAEKSSPEKPAAPEKSGAEKGE